VKKIILSILFFSFVFVGQITFAQNKEVHISISNLTGAQSLELAKPQKEIPSEMHIVTITKQNYTTRSQKLQRSPQLSEEQLVILGYNKEGKEVTQLIIHDPRIIRGETLDPSGKLTFHGLFYRNNVKFSIIVPDQTSKIEIYSLKWIGANFELMFLGETELPLAVEEKVSLEPQPYTVTKIVDNGPNSIRMIFLGDGYVASEMSKYASDVENVINGFFSEEPFFIHQKYFSILKVDIVSKESGCDHPESDPPIFRDTELGCYYDCANIERLVCLDWLKVYDILNYLSLDQDIVIIIVNDPKYGGSGGSFAVVYNGDIGIEVNLHETGGHVIGLLYDEYEEEDLCNISTDEPVGPNVTRETIRSRIKWNTGGGPPLGWILLSTLIPTYIPSIGPPLLELPIGLWEGGAYCSHGIFRPTYTSKMRDLYAPFFEVNEEAIVKRIYNFVSPIDYFSPPNDTNLTIQRSQSQVFQVATPTPTTYQLEIKWYVDGLETQSGNEFTLNSTNFNVGSHEIKVIVHDPTEKVRYDPEGLLTESVSWIVNITPVTFQYNLTTNPLGLQIVVDGVTYTPPKSFTWFEGTSHIISVASPQSGIPGTRYIYFSWSDGGAQNHNITTPSFSTTYTANFTTQYSLTTSVAPSMGGNISPSGTNWYNSGQNVEIQETPSVGYTFNNWSGDISGIVNPTLITMNGPKNVVANFTQDQYNLTVNIAPAGFGSVVKNPDKTTYVYGDLVTLTAAANPGYTFSNWSGDITSSTNPITITMNGNKTITSNFTQNQYTLTMNIIPYGSGSITKSPDKAFYIYGEQVILTALPNSGYMFSSWSGDISGTSNPVTLTIYNNKTITANFTELIGPDLTGSWTTPVTQTCKSTKKGPKCTITGILTVKNFGNRDASSSTVKFYLSDSNTYDQADTQLKSTTAGKIKAKQIKSIKLSKSFPLGQIVTDKYIIAVIDKYNAVKEVDETNNIIVFGPIQ